jgi:hypothetical protein
MKKLGDKLHQDIVGFRPDVDPRSSGILRSLWWSLLTEVSGQRFDFTSKVQSIQDSWIDCLETPVRNYHYTLYNISYMIADLSNMIIKCQLLEWVVSDEMKG